VFGDVDLSSLGTEALAAVRRQHFGFVFQFAELVPELSLRDNISLPLELLRVPRRERQERVEHLLAKLDLSEHADRRPSQVSGGQAQRAAVGRALVHRPSVVFADEPTGSLDSRNGQVVLELFLAASRDIGAAVVLVTHDPNVASWADREVVVRDGRVGAGVAC
jgi:putative ABC transport system ATP-binding protein